MKEQPRGEFTRAVSTTRTGYDVVPASRSDGTDYSGSRVSDFGRYPTYSGELGIMRTTSNQ